MNSTLEGEMNRSCFSMNLFVKINKSNKNVRAKLQDQTSLSSFLPRAHSYQLSWLSKEAPLLLKLKKATQFFKRYWLQVEKQLIINWPLDYSIQSLILLVSKILISHMHPHFSFSLSYMSFYCLIDKNEDNRNKHPIPRCIRV